MMRDLGPERILNARNQRGQTPLYCAAAKGHSNVVLELLLEPSVQKDFQVVKKLVGT